MPTPLYQGNRPEATPTPQPLDTPTLATQANTQAIQRGAAALDATLNRFYDIQDFGESQRVEQHLRDNNAAMDAEFDRLAALAPGSEESLYDHDGRLIPTRLDTLVSQYARHIDNLRTRYIRPAAQRQSDTLASQTRAALRTRAYGKATQREIQVSRQAYAANLAAALGQHHYDEARDINRRARQNSLITQPEADYNDWQYSQQARIRQYRAAMIQSPFDLAAQIENGHYDDLDPVQKAALDRQLETALRQSQQQIPLTEQERAIITDGGSVRPQYADMPGDTENMRTWRQAKRTGTLHRHRAAIDEAWQQDIFNAPVLQTRGEYNQWKHNLIRTYCDPKTGFDADPDAIALAADDRIAHNLGLAEADDYLDASRFFDAIDPQDISPDMHARWRHKADKWYLTDANRREHEGSAYDEYIAQSKQIKHDAYKAFLYWRAGNPGKPYYTQYQKACTLLADRAAAHNEQTAIDDSRYFDKYSGSDWRDGQKARDAAALTAQQQAYAQRQQDKIASAARARQTAAQETTPNLPPILATDIENIPDEAPGAYLTREDYEEIVKRFGDHPILLGTLPGRGGQRAFCRVPVLGWHEGTGTLLTRGARHRQLGKLGKISALEIRFAKDKDSKPVTPDQLDTHLKTRQRTAAQPTLFATPDDDGLLPPLDPNDDGTATYQNDHLETAVPISDTLPTTPLPLAP